MPRKKKAEVEEITTTKKADVAEKARKVKKEPAVAPAQAKKSLLFVTSECQPFLATGGLGEVAGSLPKAIAKKGEFDVSVIMPLYSEIDRKTLDGFRYVANFNVPLGWRSQYCGIFELIRDGVRYYFIDNEYYFKRCGLYGHYDDGERFAFFSRAVIEMCLHLNLHFDVIHCNDWQTALIPVYIKAIYGYDTRINGARVVFTIHNIEYQGKYSLQILEDVFGIDNSCASLLEYNGLINLVKGAIQTADIVSTVSPTYAKEILSPAFSHGLNFILEKNSYKLRGILNGIDVESYNPETDKALFKNYGKDDVSGKAVNKAELQKMLDLPQNPDVPVVALISRLVQHKGLDLVMNVIEEYLQQNVQFVLLGKGDPIYENYFVDLQRVYSSKVRAIIAYNMDTSRKIYAGADVFLMPSKAEPCGLSQMIASRYGTVPIVRETGGLYDSIKDIGNEGGGNGFTFANFNSRDMLFELNRAATMYRDKEEWSKLVKTVMSVDFSWLKSAELYTDMYRSVL